MSNLPPGWEWATLGEIATSVKNGIFVSRPGSDPDGIPILRISSVRPMELDLADIRYSGKSAEELCNDGALIAPDDLLFTRYSGSRNYVGVCARVPDGITTLTYPDKLIRVRVPEIDSKYLAFAFASPIVRSSVEQSLRTTAGQIGISGVALKGIRVPVAPLAEQRRIVATLEEHLSRLDAGAATLRSGKLRAARLKVDVVDGLFRHIEGSNTELLGSLIREPLRNGYSGPTSSDGIRAITLTAVTKRSFIDEHTKNIKIVNRNVDDLWLQSGDIFVQRSNTPDLVGTSALYDGPSGWAIFPDLLIRVRVNQRVNPEYMNLCLSSSTIRDKLKQAAKGLAGSMPKIDQPTLEGLAVPTPSLEDQQRIVAEAASTQGACSRLASQLDVAEQRSGQLRRSLLAEAFAGHLVPQDPDDEPASVLLERVKAERTAAPKPKRTRKTTTTQGSAK